MIDLYNAGENTSDRNGEKSLKQRAADWFLANVLPSPERYDELDAAHMRHDPACAETPMPAAHRLLGANYVMVMKEDVSFRQSKPSEISAGGLAQSLDRVPPLMPEVSKRQQAAPASFREPRVDPLQGAEEGKATSGGGGAGPQDDLPSSVKPHGTEIVSAAEPEQAEGEPLGGHRATVGKGASKRLTWQSAMAAKKGVGGATYWQRAANLALASTGPAPGPSLAEVVMHKGEVGGDGSGKTFRVRKSAKDHASRVAPTSLGRTLTDVVAFEEVRRALRLRGVLVLRTFVRGKSSRSTAH